MTKSATVLLTTVLSACCCLPRPVATAAESRAVLVGVGEYPALGERFRLRGPANDVDMVARLLVSRFGFQPGDIVRLTEESGGARPDLLPTRANILRELEALATRSRAGDRVFVLLAGHGSQQPSHQAPGAESGGLDEIFLPRDVERWSDAAGCAGVPNAIVDDEFHAWLTRLADTGATSWVVFDCCHSGDMARSAAPGPPGETERSVPPEALSIPAAAAQPGRRTPPAGDVAADRFETLVVTYACQSGEKTVDRRFPDDDRGVPCGLLASTLAQALETTDKPVAYGQLLAEIHRLYRAEGRVRGPTPYSEGDVTRSILATDRLANRTFTVERDPADGGLTLDAGALHGLVTGSILVVRRPLMAQAAEAGRGQPLVHVEVVDVGVRTCRVRPVAHDGFPAPGETTLDGGLAAVVVAAVGDTRVRVACGAADPADPLATLRARLEAVDALRTSVAFVPPDSGPDWTIRRAGDDLVLAPAAAAAGAEHRLPAGDGLDGSVRSLADRLSRVARAEMLLRVASRCPTATGTGLTTEALSDSGRHPPGEPLRLRAGERFTLSVTNAGRRARDVTLLHVSADQVISALFPEALRGETSRLDCGDARSLRLRCDEHSTGREWIVVLAVDARGAPVDFTGLADPAQASRAGGTSWLADVLASGGAPTRGIGAQDPDGCTADVIAVDIAADARP